RYFHVTGVQTCALPILSGRGVRENPCTWYGTPAMASITWPRSGIWTHTSPGLVMSTFCTVRYLPERRNFGSDLSGHSLPRTTAEIGRASWREAGPVPPE